MLADNLTPPAFIVDESTLRIVFIRLAQFCRERANQRSSR
jgi:hypothetical protein